MDDKEFQKLVNLICQKILGMGTITFSDGKDGGKDGKFTGKANKFPSEVSPWDGKFIIQAKHTTKPIASCSDSDFETQFKKELPKIKELKKNNEIDYYLIFTNRKLAGKQDSKIEKIDVENYVFGNETIQLWLQQYPDIVKMMELNKLLMPLEIYEKDLQEIVIAFSVAKTSNKELKGIQDDLTRIPIEQKNKLNKLGKDYYDDVLKQSYSEFKMIESFLEDPKNDKYKEKYDNTTRDIQEEITIKRDDYFAFEEILNHLYKLMLDTNDEKLKNKRNFIRVFLHYMYVNCEIGKKVRENA